MSLSRIVLDNVTLFWLTNTGISSARLYWENKFAFLAPKGVSVPVAVSALVVTKGKFSSEGSIANS